jgi:hypothetical protein
LYPRRFISGAEQDVGETAADMPEQRHHERDQRAGNAGDLDQQAKQDEQRDCQQHHARHSLLHAADHDEQRRSRADEEIERGADDEGERNRQADQDERAEQQHEKDDEVEIADGEQQRPREPQRAAHRRGDEQRRCDLFERRAGEQPQQRQRGHQRNPHCQRAGAIGFGNVQRGHRDDPLAFEMIECRRTDRQDGHRDKQVDDGVEPAPVSR